MFVKKVKNSKGRVFLEVVDGVRGEGGRVKHIVAEKLGYLDDLDAEHGDGLSWAQERARELTEEGRPSAQAPEATPLKVGESRLRHLGAMAALPILRRLGLKDACDAVDSRNPRKGYSSFDVIRLLILAQIHDPGSKRSAWLSRAEYLVGHGFSEDQMYRAIQALGRSWGQIKDFLYEATAREYGVDLTYSHYDGCNFYFEIDREDEFRRKGPSKEGRPEPIVAFGLTTDADLIPIDADVYPGNEPERPHFAEAMARQAKRRGSRRSVYVADRGLNSGDNCYRAMAQGDGYIYGQSISSEKMRKWALLDSGYEDVRYDDLGRLCYKRKSWVDEEAELEVTGGDGRKRRVRVVQKQIVFWSRDYAEKQARERARLVAKAKAFCKSPKSYTRAKVGDAAKFVTTAEFDEATGELRESCRPSLDAAAIARDAELDGYFMVVSSETKMADQAILDAYSAQKGEELIFRVSKHFLKLRPVWLSREDCIKCHFLICYICDLVLRILEVKVLKRAVPFERVGEELREYDAAAIATDCYFVLRCNQTVSLLAAKSGADASKATLSLQGAKKLFKGY